MNREEMIRLHQRHNEEELNQGDLSVVDELFASDYVRHVTGMPDIVGREAEKQFTAAIRAGFPDIHFTVEDRRVDGNRLFARWTAQGTHRGEYMGIPATGRPVTVAGMVIHRIEEGQFQESWDIVDNLSMLQQLGLVPEM
ncbi:MAG: ester cyclase [Candidatus Promineifilaceae bacterium]|nr:ester cyclase [Candidatus Promineifilaceae bacterium]